MGTCSSRSAQPDVATIVSSGVSTQSINPGAGQSSNASSSAAWIRTAASSGANTSLASSPSGSITTGGTVVVVTGGSVVVVSTTAEVVVGVLGTAGSGELAAAQAAAERAVDTINGQTNPLTGFMASTLRRTTQCPSLHQLRGARRGGPGGSSLPQPTPEPIPRCPSPSSPINAPPRIGEPIASVYAASMACLPVRCVAGSPDRPRDGWVPASG